VAIRHLTRYKIGQSSNAQIVPSDDASTSPLCYTVAVDSGNSGGPSLASFLGRGGL